MLDLPSSLGPGGLRLEFPDCIAAFDSGDKWKFTDAASASDRLKLRRLGEWSPRQRGLMPSSSSQETRQKGSRSRQQLGEVTKGDVGVGMS